MENSLYLILVGFLIYGAKRLLTRQSTWIYLAAFVLIGSGVTAGLNAIAPIEAPGNSSIPVWFTACMGALTGLLLWAADRYNMLNTSTLKFSVLAILTGVHATLSFFMYKWFAADELLLMRMSIIGQAKFGVYIHFVLLAALSFFGFTIMERAIQRSNLIQPKEQE